MPRQYFFWKYLNTIIVLYCIKVQKIQFLCNFRPFNAHIQIFSYVFLNFSQQILHLPKFILITMRSPYLIRYEVFNVITMRCPYFIRYKVLCHCERKIGDPAGYFCTRGEKEYASIRQAIVACDSRLVKREAYDASPGRVTLL